MNKIDSEAAIQKNLYCKTCGYNLRGLFAYSRCPECGEAIASSVMQQKEWYGYRLMRIGVLAMSLWSAVIGGIGWVVRPHGTNRANVWRIVGNGMCWSALLAGSFAILILLVLFAGSRKAKSDPIAWVLLLINLGAACACNHLITRAG
jgi:predicted RNA-binding Zn-ribbon protein involved in translation (DUF1610 family)